MMDITCSLFTNSRDVLRTRNQKQNQSVVLTIQIEFDGGRNWIGLIVVDCGARERGEQVAARESRDGQFVANNVQRRHAPRVVDDLRVT